MQNLHLCIDMQNRYLAHKPGAEVLVQRAKRLVAGLGARGIQTVWVFQADHSGVYRPDILPPAERLSAFAALKQRIDAFSPWHPDLPVSERSTIFVKPCDDARFENPLNDYLKAQGNPRELYSGVNGQPCVAASALGAIREGQHEVAIALPYTLSDGFPDQTGSMAQRAEEIRRFMAKRLADMRCAEQALDRGVPESGFSSILLTGAKSLTDALASHPVRLLGPQQLQPWLGQPPRRTPTAVRSERLAALHT